jgi:hypothetical protein
VVAIREELKKATQGINENSHDWKQLM